MAATMRKQDVRIEDSTQQTAIVDDTEAMPFTPVDALKQLGVQQTDVKKLQDMGFRTVESVIMSTKRKLADIKGLSDAKVEKIKEGANKIGMQGGKGGFQRAREVLDYRQRTVMKLTTGSKELDAILGGGVETGSLTEVYGEFRTGKSQLAMTLAVVSLLPEAQSGGDGRVLYLDSEGSFRPERIAQIAKRFNYPEEMALDNIHMARIYNPDNIDELLVQATAMLVEEEYRLLIIDSIMMPFRFEYSGRGELSERQQRLGQSLTKVKKMAEEFNIAVYLTNQVTADPGAMFANAMKPVGGNVLAHIVDTRVSLRKGKGSSRIAKLIDSPMMPEAEAHFSVDEGGVVEAQD